MTDRELMQMALETLEGDPELLVDWLAKLKEVKEALRQALAMKRFSEVSQEIEEAMKQEPVAWMCEGNDWGVWKPTVILGNDLEAHKKSSAFRNWQPLYKDLPKREWVGLSFLDKTFLRTAYAQSRPLYHDKKEDVSVAAEIVTDWDVFFAAIEAKLKEKNT